MKLKLLKDGEVLATKDDRDHHNDGPMYLNNQRALKDAYIFRTASMNGPAQALASGKGEHLFDVVPALKSSSIPPFAAERLKRFRPSGWPSSGE